MKKLVVLFGIALLCGCTTDKIENYTVDNDTTVIYNSFEDAFNHSHGVSVVRFYENEHTYIMFTGSFVNRGFMGVVHDPDCKKCKNNIMFSEE